MVCTHDLKGIVLSINTHGAQTLGRQLDDILGHSLEQFIPEDRRASLIPYLQKIAETGEAQGLLHLLHTDGDIRVIAYRNKLIDAPGRERYVLGFGVDITEQVRAEGRLRTLTRQAQRDRLAEAACGARDDDRCAGRVRWAHRTTEAGALRHGASCASMSAYSSGRSSVIASEAAILP